MEDDLHVFIESGPKCVSTDVITAANIAVGARYFCRIKIHGKRLKTDLSALVKL